MLFTSLLRYVHGQMFIRFQSVFSSEKSRSNVDALGLFIVSYLIILLALYMDANANLSWYCQ